MMIVRVRKAQPTVQAEPIDDVTIVIGDINGTMPDNVSLDDVRRLFALEAADIAAALTRSLPGGTLDQLTSILLQRKASLLVVRAPAVEYLTDAAIVAEAERHDATIAKIDAELQRDTLKVALEEALGMAAMRSGEPGVSLNRISKLRETLAGINHLTAGGHKP